MGQGKGASGTAMSGDDVEQLREEIEETREQLGDTIEALAAKTDVKAQVHRRLEETKASARQRKQELLGRKDELVRQAHETSGPQVANAASQLATRVRANPWLGPGLGGLLIGYLAGKRRRG
jgi:ElaB/YqjD/DUF883 family membrane-anchored ribosome-binding protein